MGYVCMCCRLFVYLTGHLVLFSILPLHMRNTHSVTYTKIPYKGATVKSYPKSTTGQSVISSNNQPSCTCESFWSIVNNVLTPTAGERTVSIPTLVVTQGFTIASDAKIKCDITDIPMYDVDKLLLLSGKTYSFINGSSSTHYGYIAQDVERVYPELVTNQLDGDGIDGRDGGVYKSIDYIGIIPIVVEKIKELEHRLNILEGK